VKTDELIVVGIGPGPVKYLTQEARDLLLATERVYFRFSGHPVYTWLREQGKECLSFDSLYMQDGMTYERLFLTIDQALIRAAKKSGRAVYALPGNPYVFELTPKWLKLMCEQERMKLRIVPAMSFLDELYVELEVDPEAGLQILNASSFSYYGDYPFTEKLGLLIGQVGLPQGKSPRGKKDNVQALTKCLLAKFPRSHRVTLIWSTGMPDYQNRRVTVVLKDLPKQARFTKHLATLYVPPVKPPWEWVDNASHAAKQRAKKKRPKRARATRSTRT